MSARTRAIIGVVIMSALLVLYFVFAGVRAFALFASGTPIAIAMGAALLILPLIGAWALARELLFGMQATALVDQLESEDFLPDDLGEVKASGKPERAAADAAFPRYRDEAEADPENWRSWARLSIAYDACGDRSRARKAIRSAISLERNEIRSNSQAH